MELSPYALMDWIPVLVATAQAFKQRANKINELLAGTGEG
jgi:hypothetical protein